MSAPDDTTENVNANNSISSPDDPLASHHKPANISDRIAFRLTKMLRFCADTFFAKRYGHRAVILETVAGVPGMVSGMLRHMRSLRLDPHPVR
jgi:ubiquinol oxidase